MDQNHPTAEYLDEHLHFVGEDGKPIDYSAIRLQRILDYLKEATLQERIYFIDTINSQYCGLCGEKNPMDGCECSVNVRHENKKNKSVLHAFECECEECQIKWRQVDKLYEKEKE